MDYYKRYISEKPNYALVDIYADEGISGTNTKKRDDFRRMIADCEAGKIDMVITKSISRFARNTQDCLENYRKLKALGITLIFEKENINSDDTTGELLLTILSSLAQDESRNISENSKWGIRSKFQKGIPVINTTNFLGYDKDKNGNMVINEKQAKIVRRIFREYLEGACCGGIAAGLMEDGVIGVSGKPKWYRITIENMLKNERYMGDSLLQKSYTEDFLTKKMVKNEGQVAQYYVTDSHPGIIPKSEWRAVQQETERRNRYKQEHGLTQVGHGKNTHPFFSKIICGECGRAYSRFAHARRGDVYWGCANKSKCSAQNITEATIDRTFVAAWNQVVKCQDDLQERWDEAERKGSELQILRTRQIRGIALNGEINEPFPELVRAVLEYIVVKDKKHYEVHFLDGTALEVEFD